MKDTFLSVSISGTIVSVVVACIMAGISILLGKEWEYMLLFGTHVDMAEIEQNVMTRQCLSRRIADIKTLKCELSSWESERNSSYNKIVWQFQTKDARVKLASLYPKIIEW